LNPGEEANGADQTILNAKNKLANPRSAFDNLFLLLNDFKGHLVCCPRSSQKKLVLFPNRHARESRHPEAFGFPGFRVAPAIASLPAMTIPLCDEFLGHQTST
jgi:hypothetical protein